MAVLRVLSGPACGRTFPVVEPGCRLGRGNDCELREIFINAPEVSRSHALIERIGGDYVLSDAQSRHGTFLNGVRLSKPVVLRDGDRISICGFNLAFHESAAAAAFGSAAADQTQFIEQIEDSSIQSQYQLTTPPETASPHEDLRVRALVQMLAGLGESLDLYHVLDRALDALLRIFPQADRGFVGLKTDTDEVVVPAAVKHRDPARRGPVKVCRTIARRAMAGEAVRLLDAPQAAMLKESESIAGLPLRSVLCAPLMGSDGEALGVVQVDTSDHTYFFRHADLEVLAAVARLLALAVQYAQWHRRALAREAEQRDLETARQVQRNLLPQGPPDFGSYRFFAFYEPALHVAGDYYDYIPLPDGKLAVLVADAAGKGVSAALVMMTLSGELRLGLASESGPGDALSRANQRLLASGGEGPIVTLCLAVLDLASDEVRLVNAGHPDPLRRRAHGAVEAIDCGPRQFPLGVDAGERYREARVPLARGERLVLFSDGFTDARNIRGELYGDGRFQEAMARGGPDVEGLGQCVVDDVREFSVGAGQSDDMCLVCLGRA